MYNLVDIHFHTDDSFDAFENQTFDADELINVLQDSDPDKSVKLLCKTDHNILNFNKYLELAKKFEKAGIRLLPGIEINSVSDVHWLFIFDDTSLCIGLPEDNDYHGLTLDDKINEFFHYDTSGGYESIKAQAKQEQNKEHDLKNFIGILHELNVPYIAIPHLNKTKGWYAKLKKDESQLAIVEEFLNSNIINGFESKNQDDFIYKNISDTESHILSLQKDYSEMETLLTDGEKQEKLKAIERRLNHLKKLNELGKSISTGDVSLIYGSDFHCHGDETIESYRAYKDKLFYMKADNTFEGLRISLLDQYSRIFFSARKDKFSKKAVICIDKLRVLINHEEHELLLGDGLNSVIGARGTGKSYFLNMLINKTEKYKGSSINSDIKLIDITFSNGEVKPFLSSSDYDILTQRGTTSDTEHSENSIYGLLADAPYKMDAYLKEIENLSKDKKDEKKTIQDNIDRVNEQFDLFIQLNDLRQYSIDFSYINTYNTFYLEESDNVKLSDLITSTEDHLNNELQRFSNITDTIDDANNNIIKLETDIDKLSKVKELPALDFDFSSEKDILKELKDEKLNKLKAYISEKQTNYKRLLQVVERCLTVIHDSSTNTLNVLNQNINALKAFIEKTVSTLRVVRKRNQILYDKLSEPCKDETIYTLDVGRSKFFIKTISELNFFNIEKNIFENMFNKYRISYASDVLVQCFDVNDYGKSFIKMLYEKLDKRFRSLHLEFPPIDKHLYLDFGNGEFKNWAVLSPGERADKLLDIVLNGNSGKILLIDQPEDDLDNETIYRTLVNKIRELKLRRQIIVVTHNANVAITGDSDRLIVCQNDDDHFSCYADGIESLKTYDYISINSKIENRKILLIAAEILDGGKEALRKRVRKIGYKDIFYKEQEV